MVSLLAAVVMLSVMLTSCCSAKAQEEEKLFRVSGQMIYFPPQCSGTLREEYLISTKPIPLANTVFHFKRGSKNSVADTVVVTIKTDSAGYFGAMLTRGEYVLLHQFQKDTLSINALRLQSDYYAIEDENLLIESYLRPIAAIKIEDKNIDSLIYKINVTCFTPPGMQGISYIGPMPE